MTDQQREFEKIAENTAFQILEYQMMQVDIEKLLLQRLNEAYAKGRQSVLSKIPSEEQFVEKFVAIFDFNNGSYEQDASTMYAWLTKEIKRMNEGSNKCG